MAHHDMRAPAATHMLAGDAKVGVNLVNPGPPGIDHNPGAGGLIAALGMIADHAVRSPGQGGVVQGVAGGVQRLAVQHQLQPQPFGLRDLRLVIQPCAFQGRVEVGHIAVQGAGGQHLVARQGAKFAAIEIIQRQPHRDDRKAPVIQRRVDPQEPRGGTDDAAEIRPHRHDAGQSGDIMRRGLQQHVALGRGFADQPEFAGFQIFQAAVHQPG